MPKIMRASLLSRPRNVAERFPCPDTEKPRVVWAIPGFDLSCSVAKPKRWSLPIVPPKPKLVIGEGYACRQDLSHPAARSAQEALRAGLPLTGFGFPRISRPHGLCLKHRRG